MKETKAALDKSYLTKKEQVIEARRDIENIMSSNV